jgi:uncharacterized protein (TIGR02246 family)
MNSNDIHEQLLLAYDAAQKRHRQVIERFFPVVAYGHGQRFERPGERPAAEDLAALTRLADEERAAQRAWVESYAHGAARTDNAVRALYGWLLDAWNERDADAYASLFADDATVIGFDGSLMRGLAAIRDELTRIFADHETARYVSIVRDVRTPGAGAALLLADAGMVPRGVTELNPQVNARHVLLATHDSGAWRIALFQNTPAALHGRDDLREQLTAELREALATREQLSAAPPRTSRPR